MSEATNLLILFSDQHSRHMVGCYGNPAVKTPNLDGLAARGVCFDSAYTNCPVCVPSRAAMAVGDYGSRHGYWDNAHAYEGAVKSWGGRLEEEGFRVTTIGKLHFKGDMAATGFTDQRIPLHMKDGVGDIYGEIRDKCITRPQFRTALLEARAGESDYTRYDREVARRAADYLRQEGAEDGNPFALMVGFTAPHFPLVVPEEYVKMYPDPDALPLPVQFRREEWPSHPVLDDYRRYCCQADLPDPVKRNAIRIYYGLCSFLDAQIGVVLDALRESGLDNTTRVLYCTDHGDTMGEHGLFFKSTMYEGSAGIPMIFAGPGLPRGHRCGTGVSLVDVYPTVLDCMGISRNEQDKRLPGRSLLEVAGAPEQEERDVYSEYMGFGCYTGVFMLRRGRYKLIYYVGERPQLFDLKADPGECRDLAGEEDMAGVLEDLKAGLRAIVNPQEAEEKARRAQACLLEQFGGREEFLKKVQPSLFSPIPSLD